MRILTLLLLIAGLALTAAPASATLYTWATNAPTGVGSPSPYCAGSVNCSQSYTSTSGGLTLTALAYSTSTNNVYNSVPIAPNDTTSPGVYNSNGKLIAAEIDTYSGGIGVSNLVPGDASGEHTSPEHAIDNNGARDVVVFDFGSAGWDPTSIQLGWISGDSDVQAWIGGGNTPIDFQNVCLTNTSCPGTSLSSLGFADISAGIGTTGGQNLSTSLQTITTNSTGRYLVVSGALTDANFDNFKISSLSARKVPLPGSLYLLGLGLLILGWARVSTSTPVPRPR